MDGITNSFFKGRHDAFNHIYDYAPNDNQLLDIPNYMMATSPFLLAFNNPLIQDPRKGMSLHAYLRSINTLLAISIAAYSFIKKNYNKQLSNDYEVLIHSEILALYQSSLRDSIANLKIAVDQMLIVLAVKNDAKYDCIGGFLKQLHQYQKFNCLEYFFLKLNTAANYLKHHIDQLESFQEIHLVGLKIRVIVDRKDDYKSICNHIAVGDLIEKTEKKVVYYLSLNELIVEFNRFKELFLEVLQRH